MLRSSAQCHLVLGARCLTKTFHESYGLVMESSAVFDLYLQLAPAELFRLLQRQMGVIVHDGIYSARLVIWMMIHQRLQSRGTLAHSVEQLVQGRFDPLPSQCKRVQEKKIALGIAACPPSCSPISCSFLKPTRRPAPKRAARSLTVAPSDSASRSEEHTSEL